MRIENADESGERPFEYADPRSLSQAWYDALYGEHRAQPAQPPVERRAQRASDGGTDPGDRATASETEFTGAAPRASEASQTAAARREIRGATDPERAPRELERRRLADAARPQPAPGQARSDVDIRDAEGNEIRLLLAQRGEDVEVVAVTDPAAGARVAEALESARLALGARGIGLRASIQERGER